MAAKQQSCPGAPAHVSAGRSEFLLQHRNWLRGKHIVFVGDSRTRYQYLNLAFLLLHGEHPPFDLSERGDKLMQKFWPNGTHPPKYGDYEGYWAAWYNASNAVLKSPAGYEICDCWRGTRNNRENVDMRYTISPRLGAALTYAQWFGDDIPFQGHWHPRVHGGAPHLNCTAGYCRPPFHWVLQQFPCQTDANASAMANRTASLGVELLLHEVLLALTPRPTHIVFGARWKPLGLSFAQQLMDYAEALARRLGQARPTYVWKSDIYPSNVDRSKQPQPPKAEVDLLQAARHHGWIAIDQFKISQPFDQTCYNDKLHLNEAGETYLNEVLLRTLISRS